ncbi:MAG: neutral zinc metallopeptidase [Vicinamibacteria bacterium]|jgi:predicted metalloprotease|nr:neutral zinc metallopeptidase [Vicinamibacteria bacterium]
MRLEGRTESVNVEDRRGRRMRGGPAGLGCGGLLLVLALSYFTGQDPQTFLQILSQVQNEPAATDSGPSAAPNDQLGKFAAIVLADTEETWRGLFAETGQTYEEPPLVLFSEGVRSGCGAASSATGPFYCPADHKVYLDPVFFNQLSQRFGAPGDFAQAYVIAHEVGHHVQNLLGVSARVTEAQQRGSEAQANALSVRLELQADCFAGVWGHRANRDRKIIEPGDFEEGMRAAASIGDDAIQEMSQGSVQPESWTHGSSEQRQFWLRRGLSTGDPNRCDTFKETRP